MTRSPAKPKKHKRVDGKCRLATLALMDLTEDEGELALTVSRWETGWKCGVGGKKRVPARCGPRPILGTLVSCGCPNQWRVAPSQLKKRCFICHQWRKPLT